MKGCLVARPLDRGKNMGDYIQSVAQEQFLDKVDCYVEREELDQFQSHQKVKLIMNAWFMLYPEHFPPSDSIIPYYISFHIVEGKEKKMMTPKTIAHLKKYEPIGARDFATRDMLQKYGVKSYFSGCLTLTLGLKYKSEIKDNIVYFVDPYYELAGVVNRQNVVKLICKSFVDLLRYWKNVKQMTKFNYEVRYSLYDAPKSINNLIGKFMCASFYRTYSKAFSDDLLYNAEFLMHRVNVDNMPTEEARMQYARDLVARYAKAKLVVTSRLHCALPCLGVETPVIFVNSDALEQGKLRTAGRFGGNLELLHCMKWTPKGVVAMSEEIEDIMSKGKIDRNIQLKNKDAYKVYRDQMIEKVRGFIKSK